jgi:hypothetical protein
MKNNRAQQTFLGAICATLALSTFNFGQTVEAKPDQYAESKFYVPSLFNLLLTEPRFGVEVDNVLIPGSAVYNRTRELGATVMRINWRVSWKVMQGAQNAPIDFSSLAPLETMLRGLDELEIRPMLIVDDYPLWATTVPSSCAPIRPDRYADFAEFLRQMVLRYKVPPYNVKMWELGNEPDVDWRLVSSTSNFGCWGNKNDTQFYGGAVYGEMLKAVVPVIRSADPEAKILIGGLLLDNNNTQVPAGEGKPELFINGVLASGAAGHFDYIPYHAYSYFSGAEIDYSNKGQNGKWVNNDPNKDGIARGKPIWLKDAMTRYGVSKPLILNEVALVCVAQFFPQVCESPGAAFYNAQANYVAPAITRALAQGVEQIVWYTLDGPGWNNVGLLDGDGTPRPAYFAYKNLIAQLNGTNLPPRQVNYVANTEAYRFTRGPKLVDVVWSTDSTPKNIRVPIAQFLSAVDRDGNVINPTTIGNEVQITVGLGGVYIVRTP